MPRILVVDDIPFMRTQIAFFLRNMGHEVAAEVGDGLAVLDTYTKCMPDAVCLDLGLPGMDGLDVLRQLKQTYADCRVVIVSATHTGEHESRAFALGAKGFVHKPLSAAELRRALEIALDPHSADGRLALEEQAMRESIALTLQTLAETDITHSNLQRLATTSLEGDLAWKLPFKNQEGKTGFCVMSGTLNDLEALAQTELRRLRLALGHEITDMPEALGLVYGEWLNVLTGKSIHHLERMGVCKGMLHGLPQSLSVPLPLANLAHLWSLRLGQSHASVNMLVCMDY